jgi:hypothetical protein
MSQRTPHAIIRDLHAFAEQESISERLRYQSLILAWAADSPGYPASEHLSVKPSRVENRHERGNG